jgi:3-polyprenyl-4-hydroxybenzoate decarboxylase
VAQINQSQLELADHMKENIDTLRQLQSQVLDEELIKSVPSSCSGKCCVIIMPCSCPNCWAKAFVTDYA